MCRKKRTYIYIYSTINFLYAGNRQAVTIKFICKEDVIYMFCICRLLLLLLSLLLILYLANALLFGSCFVIFLWFHFIQYICWPWFSVLYTYYQYYYYYHSMMDMRMLCNVSFHQAIQSVFMRKWIGMSIYTNLANIPLRPNQTETYIYIYISFINPIP